MKKIHSEHENDTKNEYKNEYDPHFNIDELIEQLRSENKYLKDQSAKFIALLDANSKQLHILVEDIKIATTKKAVKF